MDLFNRFKQFLEANEVSIEVSGSWSIVLFIIAVGMIIGSFLTTTTAIILAIVFMVMGIVLLNIKITKL